MLRREFLAAAAAVPAAASAIKPRPTVAVFSKPLQKLSCDELGRAIRRCGLRHVDLTVRPGGHVLPERVREDLPRAVQALEAQGVGTAMITTAITSASDPAARPVLSEAARLKVPLYKLGYWRYRDNDIEETLLRVKRDVTGLVALGKAVGIQAAWHNHSGDYVGLAIWDTHEIIRDLDPKWIGYYFDLSHATAEGGVAGWQIGLRLALPRLKIVAVKDHLREKVQGKWRRRTCPLGEGMVDFPRAFSMLARAGFKGLISLHIEYDTPDPVSAIARDAAFLNQQIQRAYGG